MYQVTKILIGLSLLWAMPCYAVSTAGAVPGTPAGMIIWFGDVTNNIPSTFYGCDGLNGTPNLQGKMVIGANGTTYIQGSSYGTNTHHHVLYAIYMNGSMQNGSLFGPGAWSQPVNWTIAAGKVTSDGTNIPPSRVLAHIQSKISGGIPPNGIMGWTNGAAPTGWHTCDGTSGTQNLTNLFVMGAGNGYSVGDLIGALAHTHTATDGGGAYTMSAGGLFQAGSYYINQIVVGTILISLASISHTPPGYAVSFIQNNSGAVQGSYTGMIGIWPGSLASIPTGWTNFTALAGKFPVGAGGSYTNGQSVGSGTHSHNQSATGVTALQAVGSGGKIGDTGGSLDNIGTASGEGQPPPAGNNLPACIAEYYVMKN